MHSTGHRTTRLRLTLSITAAVIASAWLFAAPLADAQDRRQNQTTEAPTPHDNSPSNIPDEKLNAAATAIEHVTTIKENYQQRLAAAPASDHERIAGEATNALKKAITDEGLSIDEYNSIIEAALDNPNVRDQLVQRIHHTGDEKGGEK